MSRLILKLLCAALWLPALGFSQAGPALSQSPAAASAPLKIAWLNLEQAIVTCEEGKEAESLRNQLTAQADKLTDEAQVDLQDQLDIKNTAIQRFQEDTQKQIDSLRTRATNYVGRRMLPIIEKISQERKLSAVLYLNAARDAYVDPSLIITEDVIKAYNQAYPVSTPAKKP
jgi:Skp family chaperone for outer membrane proteins